MLVHGSSEKCQPESITSKLYFSLQIFYILLFLVFGPLMRLSPPPSEKDYCFNLDDSEGVCDLFDVQ